MKEDEIKLQVWLVFRVTHASFDPELEVEAVFSKEDLAADYAKKRKAETSMSPYADIRIMYSDTEWEVEAFDVDGEPE